MHCDGIQTETPNLEPSTANQKYHHIYCFTSAASLLQRIVVTETSDAPRQAPAMVSDTQCASPNTLPVAVVTAAMTHRGNAALVTAVCTLLFLVWSEFTVNGGSRTQRRVPAAPHRTIACNSSKFKAWVTHHVCGLLPCNQCDACQKLMSMQADCMELLMWCAPWRFSLQLVHVDPTTEQHSAMQ